MQDRLIYSETNATPDKGKELPRTTMSSSFINNTSFNFSKAFKGTLLDFKHDTHVLY